MPTHPLISQKLCCIDMYARVSSSSSVGGASSSSDEDLLSLRGFFFTFLNIILSSMEQLPEISENNSELNQQAYGPIELFKSNRLLILLSFPSVFSLLWRPETGMQKIKSLRHISTLPKHFWNQALNLHWSRHDSVSFFDQRHLRKFTLKI